MVLAMTPAQLSELINDAIINGSQHIDKCVDQTSENKFERNGGSEMFDKSCDNFDSSGNTLLHFAVSLNLPKEVALLLASGAKTNIKNTSGYTAYDLALENGNQTILQALKRKDEFSHHLSLMKTELFSISRLNENETSIYYSLSKVYDDYLDWSGMKSLHHLQDLYMTYSNDEDRFQNVLNRLIAQKDKLVGDMFKMYDNYKEKEHNLCLMIWDKINQEKESRMSLEMFAENVMILKNELDRLKSKVLWEGDIEIHQLQRFFIRSWKRVRLVVTTNCFSIYSNQVNKNKRSFDEGDSSSPTSRRSLGLLLFTVPLSTVSRVYCKNQQGSLLAGQSFLVRSLSRDISCDDNLVVQSLFSLRVDLEQLRSLGALPPNIEQKVFKSSSLDSTIEACKPSENIFEFRLPPNESSSPWQAQRFVDVLHSLESQKLFNVVQRDDNNTNNNNNNNNLSNRHLNNLHNTSLSHSSASLSQSNKSKSGFYSAVTSVESYMSGVSLSSNELKTSGKVSGAIGTIWEDESEHQERLYSLSAQQPKTLCALSALVDNNVATRSPFVTADMRTELMLETTGASVRVNSIPSRNNSNENVMNKLRSVRRSSFQGTSTIGTINRITQATANNQTNPLSQLSHMNLKYLDFSEENLEQIKFLIDTARDNRFTAQNRLESVLTERESLLEALHYLKALRALIRTSNQSLCSCPLLQDIHTCFDHRCCSSQNMKGSKLKCYSVNGGGGDGDSSVVDVMLSLIHQPRNSIISTSVSLSEVNRDVSKKVMDSTTNDKTSNTVTETYGTAILSNSMSLQVDRLSNSFNHNQSFGNSFNSRLAHVLLETSNLDPNKYNNQRHLQSFRTPLPEFSNNHSNGFNSAEGSEASGSLAFRKRIPSEESCDLADDREAAMRRLTYPPPRDLLKDFQELTCTLRDAWNCELGAFAANQKLQNLNKDKIELHSRIMNLREEYGEITISSNDQSRKSTKIPKSTKLFDVAL